MNLAAYLTGSFQALSNSDAWTEAFDLSRKGFKSSFIAVLFTLGFYYICALGIQSERAVLLGAETVTAVPIAAFIIIGALYILTFSACAYILAMVFDKQDRFRAWIIVRHWAVFFAAFFAAVGFGLYLVAGIPFVIANLIAFILYMGTLVIDIRLAQKIAGFEWAGAILTGCIIHAMGLTVILTGVAQFIR